MIQVRAAWNIGLVGLQLGLRWLFWSTITSIAIVSVVCVGIGKDELVRGFDQVSGSEWTPAVDILLVVWIANLGFVMISNLADKPILKSKWMLTFTLSCIALAVIWILMDGAIGSYLAEAGFSAVVCGGLAFRQWIHHRNIKKQAGA